LAALAPDEPTARGTIVLSPGDFWASRYIHAPVRLAVEDAISWFRSNGMLAG